MATGTEIISDETLLDLAIEINKNPDNYWTLGIKCLGNEHTYLDKILKENSRDKLGGTLQILVEWRNRNRTLAHPGSVLAEALKELRHVNAEKILRTGGSSVSSWQNKYSHLTNQLLSSATSSSISKGSIPVKFSPSDVESGSELASMVTSVTSSAQSRRSAASKASSTGLTADVQKIHVATPDGGNDSQQQQDRVSDWLTQNTRRGAPGGDALTESEASEIALGTDTLELRDYQVELAKPAISGLNTIVVAPTGSGKTFIAVAVSKEVLRKSRGTKIVFVVNQVPLISQQSAVFKRYIKKVSYVCGDHGKMFVPRRPLRVMMEENDVVVLTAQILVDALEKGEVLMKNIGLIIFDECHETKKHSQYNRIMKVYLRQKFLQMDTREDPDAPPELPQILGLTASLGVGGARTEGDAEKYLLKMCANLDSVKIATVQECKESLAHIENKPTEEPHVVKGRDRDDFSEEIQGMILEILTWISLSPDRKFLNKQVGKLSTLSKSNHSMDNFSHMLCKLERRISGSVKDPDHHRSLKTYTEHLKAYSSCLAIHETVRTKDAINFLRNFISQEKEKSLNLTSTDNRLIKLFEQKEERLEILSESPGSRNPGLVKLQHLIESASKNSGLTSFRAILFTQTIASTAALKDWVTDTPSLSHLAPEVLVGSRNRGMSLSHQTQVLENFRCGVHKLLIATSVAQQGIDVPACKYVFRYNYITDPVGRIQARGRARTPGGRFELVVHEYRRLLEKDVRGKEQEKLIEKTTNELSKLSPKELGDKVRDLQSRDRRQFFVSESRTKPLDHLNQEFTCKLCKRLVCPSSAIRKVRGGHHVVIDRGIKERMTISPSREDKEGEKRRWMNVEQTDRQLKCKECGMKWGSVLRWNQGFLLALSMKNLVLNWKFAIAKPYNSWGKLPFSFQTATYEEAVWDQDEIEIV